MTKIIQDSIYKILHLVYANCFKIIAQPIEFFITYMNHLTKNKLYLIQILFSSERETKMVQEETKPVCMQDSLPASTLPIT